MFFMANRLRVSNNTLDSHALPKDAKKAVNTSLWRKNEAIGLDAIAFLLDWLLGAGNSAFPQILL
jgi:hypothetical protein